MNFDNINNKPRACLIGGLISLFICICLFCICACSENLTRIDVDKNSYIEYGTNKIYFHLFENPTTGFQWTIDSTNAIKELDNEYKIDEEKDKAGMVGVGGIRHATFEVSDSGLITFYYSRPWENRIPDKKHELSVEWDRDNHKIKSVILDQT